MGEKKRKKKQIILVIKLICTVSCVVLHTREEKNLYVSTLINVLSIEQGVEEGGGEGEGKRNRVTDEREDVKKEKKEDAGEQR